MTDFDLLTATGPTPESYARTEPPARAPFRIAAVQLAWHPDPAEHEAALAEGVRLAAGAGAQLVCLQELTLSPYFAITPDALDEAQERAEPIPDGPTTRLAARLAAETGAHVHASLYERNDEDPDGLGYNTAICVAPSGDVIARTRKIHIPVTTGYYEDKYFRPGDTGYPVVGVGEARLGFPTCWDQWFPELARAYSLAGADVIVYPTAIGSEPDHPAFDTEPLWEKVIVGNGIANGTFMVAVNRIGREGPGGAGGRDVAGEHRGLDAGGGAPSGIRFYGSSFISDPYGRKLVQAGRDEPAVLVADLDLDQRRDWLALFPFLTTRRPETYAPLAES
jgi:N-carbamoylputrescine amidase